MLTRKQYELLMFIHERVRESGIPPSFDEMKDALDLKSKSGIHRLITALEERGFLRRMEKRARALEVPQAARQHGRDRAPRHHPQPGAARRCPVMRGRRDPPGRCPRSRRPRRAMGDSESAVNVPLVGRIAAGTPIEALQNKIGDVPVPSGMIGRGDHYALEVTGDSMINAGILDGDTVIIQEADSANTGEIVVALVDNKEATLKRLRRRGDSIALEAANPAYETRLYGADRVKVQGKLVGLDPAVLRIRRARLGLIKRSFWLAAELGIEYQHISRRSEDDRRFSRRGQFKMVTSRSGVPRNTKILATRYGGGSLWPADPSAKAQIDEWMDWAQTAFQPDFLNGVFWGYYRTPESQRNWPAIKDSVKRCRHTS